MTGMISLARRGKVPSQFLYLSRHGPTQTLQQYSLYWKQVSRPCVMACFGHTSVNRQWLNVLNTLCTSFTDHTNHSNLHLTVCCWQFVTAVVQLLGLLETMTALVCFCVCVYAGFKAYKIDLTIVILLVYKSRSSRCPKYIPHMKEEGVSTRIFWSALNRKYLFGDLSIDGG
jgi:hypothetical protein